MRILDRGVENIKCIGINYKLHIYKATVWDVAMIQASSNMVAVKLVLFLATIHGEV